MSFRIPLQITFVIFAMSRLIGLSGVNSLEQYGFLPGSNSEASNRKMLSSPPLAPTDSVPSGNFANLRLTIEKLVREQASGKIDLELLLKKLEEKLQLCFDENAKLTVKQKLDEKLRKGVEAKFLSTKARCNQLTGTLGQLNIQVQPDKMPATSVTLDKLHEHMKCMSMKLQFSEDTIKTCYKELMEHGLQNGNMETFLRNQQNKAACLINEKDGLLKQLEKDVASNKMDLERLTSKMKKLMLEMRLKEKCLLELRVSKEKMERGYVDLLSLKDDFSNRLEMALLEIENLKKILKPMVVKFKELEDQSLAFSKRVIQLNLLLDSCCKLAQREKDPVPKCAQQKFDQIDNRCASIISEKNALRLVNQELNNKVLKLQKEQKYAMIHHAEECRLSEAKIRKLESEANILVSKQTEMKALIIKLEYELRKSSENPRLSDEKMQDLSLKFSEFEKGCNYLVEGLKADIMKKQEEIDHLQKVFEKSEENVHLIEKSITELEKALKEMDLILELKAREKQVNDQKAEVINAIRTKYEKEMQEAVNLEKEKADQKIQDVEKKYEQKIKDFKEVSQQHLMWLQKEYAALKLKLLRSEHEAQLRENDDDCRRLQEELDLQRAKEEIQKALLQLQWKVTCDNPQEYQEVTSKKVVKDGVQPNPSNTGSPMQRISMHLIRGHKNNIHFRRTTHWKNFSRHTVSHVEHLAA